jgi:hypothetical protein
MMTAVARSPLNPAANNIAKEQQSSSHTFGYIISGVLNV